MTEATDTFPLEDDHEDNELGRNAFVTHELLDAVDAIDRLRDFLNDHPDGGPPQLRTDLLRLHQRAMHVVGYRVERNEEEKFYDDAADIADEVAEMVTLIGRVETTLNRLTDMAPAIKVD